MPKLYVGNLSWGATEEGLRELFEKAGVVLDATILRDRMTGKSRGFGFIEVPDAAAAEVAIRMFHDQVVDGRGLSVNEVRPREERPGTDSRPRRSFSDDYWSSPINAALTEVIATINVTPQLVEVTRAADAQLVQFFSKHPEEMKYMHPRKYEELIAEIWSGLGYVVELQKKNTRRRCRYHCH